MVLEMETGRMGVGTITTTTTTTAVMVGGWAPQLHHMAQTEMGAIIISSTTVVKIQQHHAHYPALAVSPPSQHLGAMIPTSCTLGRLQGLLADSPPQTPVFAMTTLAGSTVGAVALLQQRWV